MKKYVIPLLFVAAYALGIGASIAITDHFLDRTVASTEEPVAEDPEDPLRRDPIQLVPQPQYEKYRLALSFKNESQPCSNQPTPCSTTT